MKLERVFETFLDKQDAVDSFFPDRSVHRFDTDRAKKGLHSILRRARTSRKDDERPRKALRRTRESGVHRRSRVGNRMLAAGPRWVRTTAE